MVEFGVKVLQNCNLTLQEYAMQSSLSVNRDIMVGSFTFPKLSLRSHTWIDCRREN